MIKIKLATPYFFWGGGGVGVRLSCKRVVSKYSIAYAYCIILHMDATNALIDSQAMVERMVWYITAKLAGDNLESGSAIRHLHISYNASYLPTPSLPPPPLKKK